MSGSWAWRRGRLLPEGGRTGRDASAIRMGDTTYHAMAFAEGDIDNDGRFEPLAADMKPYRSGADVDAAWGPVNTHTGASLYKKFALAAGRAAVAPLQEGGRTNRHPNRRPTRATRWTTLDRAHAARPRHRRRRRSKRRAAGQSGPRLGRFRSRVSFKSMEQRSRATPPSSPLNRGNLLFSGRLRFDIEWHRPSPRQKVVSPGATRLC